MDMNTIFNNLKAPSILASVGPTEYLDGDLSPTASVMKGRDAHGRAFIVLCIEYFTKTKFGTNRGEAIITLFQRYTDGTDVWAKAENVGLVESVFSGNIQTEFDVNVLAQLLEKGEVKYTDTRLLIGPMNVELKLVDPQKSVYLRCEREV